MKDFIMGLFVGAVISWISMAAILRYLMDRYAKRK